MINSLMKISVIVPVYNESATLPVVLKKLVRIPHVRQIVLVDDASTDGTSRSVKPVKNLKKLRHKTNMGKGAAIRTAIPHLVYPFTLIQDADLEYDPTDILKLVKVLETKDEKTAVYGSRLLNTPFPKGGYLRTLLGNHIITQFTNFLYGTRLTDSYTGYKLIPTETLRSLNLTSCQFEIEAEITAKLAKAQVTILEIPISYHPRSYQKGKKIKLRDFFKALWTIAKYKLYNSA